MPGIYLVAAEGVVPVPILNPLLVSFISYALLLFFIFVVLDIRGVGVFSLVLLTPSKLVVVKA